MTNTCEKISSNKVKITFTVPADEFETAVNAAYLKNHSKFNVPGFRKGKAPRKIIENMYGANVFYEDALDDVMQKAYPEAVKEHDLKVVDYPEANVVSLKKGEDVVFEVEVFVKPDVTLGDYKNLSVEVAPKQQVTEEDINAAIEKDRQAAASETDLTEGTVADGDTVNLNYCGKVDGVAFEGGTAENQTLKIGSHQFIEGFEEQMIGMSIGEEKTLDVTFPAEYHAADLAGKPATFDVKVNSIKRTEYPALDDDFGVDKGFDDYQSYKDNVVKTLTETADKNYDISVENALVDKAVENATIDVPNGMIEEQLDYIMRDVEMRMMYQGLRMKDFLKYTGQSEKDFRDGYRDEAEKRTRTELTLEAIVKTEGIVSTDDDIAQQTKEQAERMGRKVEDFEKSLNDEQREYIKESAGIQKAIDLMKSTATVSDKVPEANDDKASEDKE